MTSVLSCFDVGVTLFQENELLRDIFSLGAVLVTGAAVKVKGTKAERVST